MGSENGLYNRYPEDIKPRSLKKGETATFEIVGGRRDVYVPNTDLISDGQGEYIQIALIKTLNQQGIPVLENIWFNARKGGKMTLKAGNAKQDRIYKYFMTCNWNESNPNRDPKSKIWFREVRPEENAAKEMDERNNRFLAVQMAREMPDIAVLEYFSMKGQSATIDEIKQLRNRLEKNAEKNPSDFLKEDDTIKETEDDMDKTLRLARKKEIISFDKESNVWSFADGKKICAIPKLNGVKIYAELISHLTNNSEGADQYQKILDGISEE